VQPEEDCGGHETAEDEAKARKWGVGFASTSTINYK